MSHNPRAGEKVVWRGQSSGTERPGQARPAQEGERAGGEGEEGCSWSCRSHGRHSRTGSRGATNLGHGGQERQDKEAESPICLFPLREWLCVLQKRVEGVELETSTKGAGQGRGGPGRSESCGWARRTLCPLSLSDFPTDAD